MFFTSPFRETHYRRQEQKFIISHKDTKERKGHKKLCALCVFVGNLTNL